MLDKQFEELRLTGRLPSPAGVGLRILEVTQSEDASLDEVVAVLVTDPMLTGRLIRFANSGDMAGRSQVANAQAAAMRLGLQTVRSISLGFSLLSGNRTGRCKSFDYDGFWEHSLAVAASAQIVARLRGDVAAADAFTCGLLQGIGRLALASIHPDAYEGVLERARGHSSAELARIEQDCFGTNHRDLAVAMLRDWRLPESFCDVVTVLGTDVPLPDDAKRETVALLHVLQDARDLARVMSADVDTTSTTCRRFSQGLGRARADLGLDDAGFQELWKQAVAAWANWGDVMGIRAKSVLTPAEVERRAASAAPEMPRPVAPVREVTAEGVGSTGLRILLAGVALARDTALKEALVAAGNTVSVTLDVRSALAATLEGAPHMVLCDWEIAGGSGLNYVHTLRLSEAGKRPHVVVIAERRHEASLLDAFQAGADEYLMRPLDTRLVVARTQATLRAVQLDERVRDLLAERETRIGELAIATRKLQIAAVTDALTGLYNRRYATERLQKAFDIARNGGGALSVLGIDLDRFKSVNDEYGHDTGDVVLQSAARAMAGLLRKGDALCRMGGEEFLAICPGATIAAAAEIGERLAAGLRANVIRHGRFERAVTGSIGVAELTSAHATIDDLLKAADQRVYLAKESGRDRVVAADPPALLRAAG